MFLPLFANGQDKITLLDSTTYDVKITKEDDLNVYFYVLSDSIKTIKKVSKGQILNYKKEEIIADIPPYKYKRQILSAGDELIRAKDHWYSGLLLEVGGSGLMMLSVKFDTPEREVFMVVGGALSLTGFILMIESWSHIGKAGTKLNNPAFSLGVNNNGATITYRF